MQELSSHKKKKGKKNSVNKGHAKSLSAKLTELINMMLKWEDIRRYWWMVFIQVPYYLSPL